MEKQGTHQQSRRCCEWGMHWGLHVAAMWSLQFAAGLAWCMCQCSLALPFLCSTAAFSSRHQLWGKLWHFWESTQADWFLLLGLFLFTPKCSTFWATNLADSKRHQGTDMCEYVLRPAAHHGSPETQLFPSPSTLSKPLSLQHCHAGNSESLLLGIT